MDVLSTVDSKSRAACPAVALACAALAAVAAGNAWSQTAPRPDSRSERDPNALEEVVVTARKREESRQEVPLSVSAISGKQLEAQGVQQILDLTNKLPNFQMQTGTTPGLTSVTVRGVEASVRNAGFQSSVSFYVDGIYQGRPLNFNQDLVDVERVELLLGPQGTLFGNNTVAGVVNVVTRKPVKDFGGFAVAQFGSDALRDVRGSANVPLGETWALRVSGAYTERDGFQENVFTGRAHGNLDRYSGRAQLLRSTESLDVLLIADFQQQDEIPQAPEYLRLFSVAGVSNFAGPPHTISQNGNGSDVTRQGVALKVDYRLAGGGMLSSVTSWKEAEADEFFDQDLGPDPRVRSDIANDEQQRLFSQELRYESDLTKRMRYTLGAFFLDDRVELTRLFDFPPPLVLLGPLGALHFQIPTFSEVGTTSYAAFGNIEFELGERLTFGLGLRYSDEQQDGLWRQSETILQGGVRVSSLAFANSLFGPSRGGFLVTTAPDFLDSRSDDSISGSATASWKISPDQRAYIRFARGTKAGGFNLEPLPDPLPPTRAFGPEELDAYELGYKSEWLDRRLLANVAVFYEDYRDLQRADVVPLQPAGATRVIRNAGEVEIKGTEIELAAVPVTGLTLRASYGFVDAKFKEFRLNDGTDLSGQPLGGVPKWNASVGFNYGVPLGNSWSFFLDASADLRGKRRLGPSDATSVSVDSYKVVDARLGLTNTASGWEVALWGRNVTDELYVTARSGGTDFFPGGEAIAYGIPRLYGVSVRYDFGGR